MTKSKSTKPFTLGNLDYMYRQKRLWLNPKYQREAVWTKSQKQLLIDSLLQEIDIPKLYFRSTTHDTYQYEVVDGQQRLRSIFEFFTDGFPLADDTDDIDSHQTAGRYWKDLHIDLQMKLRDTQLDVVVLAAGYSDDDIEEIFLRLQNGTPLNAPEKRRALPGTMREVVETLAAHKVFSQLCGFSGRRYAYEDAVAKTLHLLLAGRITDIKHSSIRKTYENNATITERSAAAVALKRSYDFLVRAFKGRPNPKLKKFSIVTLGYLVAELLETYDLGQHVPDYAEAYLDFERRRLENDDLDEDAQDSRLQAYSNAARADSVQDLEYRHETLRREIVGAIVDLECLDQSRQFSADQRQAIFLRDKGVCQECGTKCKETTFHADHRKPHSKGGKTTIANGQVLCAPCNLKKGNNG